jgi:putative ABC transport system ATP-binding protein
VFQNPFTGTASDLSVAENLVLAARRGGQRWLRQGLGRDRRRAIREKVAQLGMGLEDRLDTPMGMLSGGQRQALTVLMATTEQFTEHASVADGASDLFVGVFGSDAGHVRLVYGVQSLPVGAPLIVDTIFEIGP